MHGTYSYLMASGKGTSGLGGCVLAPTSAVFTPSFRVVAMVRVSAVSRAALNICWSWYNGLLRISANGYSLAVKDSLCRYERSVYQFLWTPI
jgi:hypothetical protein